ALRFQLPALFLLAVVISGLVSAAIALRLFREYAQNQARTQAYQELGREADGLTQLYSKRAGVKLLPASGVELATGDRVFYRGLDLFTGRIAPLPRGVVNERAIRRRKKPLNFTFQPAAGSEKLLGAALPLRVGG